MHDMTSLLIHSNTQHLVLNKQQERVSWSAPVRAARVVLPFLVALLENNTVRFFPSLSPLVLHVCAHLNGQITSTNVQTSSCPSSSPLSHSLPLPSLSHLYKPPGGRARCLGADAPPDPRPRRQRGGLRCVQVCVEWTSGSVVARARVCVWHGTDHQVDPC